MRSWIWRQRIPACTVIVLWSGEKAMILSKRRMSMWSPPSVAIWPPMLWRAPPIEIGPADLRTARTTSSVEVGVITRPTAMGFSCVTSFTISGDVAGNRGGRITRKVVTTNAKTNEATKTTPSRLRILKVFDHATTHGDLTSVATALSPPAVLVHQLQLRLLPHRQDLHIRGIRLAPKTVRRSNLSSRDLHMWPSLRSDQPKQHRLRIPGRSIRHFHFRIRREHRDTGADASLIIHDFESVASKYRCNALRVHHPRLHHRSKQHCQVDDRKSNEDSLSLPALEERIE